MIDPEVELPDIFKDSELLKLEIKDSCIPGSGCGLFATAHFAQGEYISEYYGAVLPEKYSFSEPFLLEDKMVFLNKKSCIISRSPASRANDIIKWEPEFYFSPENTTNRMMKKMNDYQGFSRNAEIKLVDRDKAFLKATRAIKPGEQIYISYGTEYWEFFFEDYLKAKKGP